MSRLLMGLVAFLVGIGAAEAGEGRGQGWADALFAERSHDFGPVPRGGVVRHAFVLNNPLDVPVTVLNLRVSCGCTSGTASATQIAPGRSAIIEAQMDTKNFVGKKATTLFVSLMAGNRETEVGLGVSCLILSDVVLNPGVVDFGLASRGQTPLRVITIDRIGKGDWKVVKMTSACKAITATIQEVKRQEGAVGYQLSVSLRPDAPAGLLRDEIRLITNDPETAAIPIPIVGQIRGELTASPASLTLGNVTSAGGVQGRYVIKASRPFAIARVEGVGDGFTLKEAEPARKSMHFLTLTFNPAEARIRGDLTRTFRITTDLPGESPVEVTASLHVDP